MADECFAALWSYPWDLLAEGLDESLARIADSGLRGISLAVSYHAGMLLLPHNPRHKVRFLEDGAVYFRPRDELYRSLALQPRVSALAESADPLELICEGAARHGLQVVAWTVCCHNSYQGERHLDLALHNAFGDPYPFALCPAQPEVQAYLQALVHNLSAYPLRTLQLESYEYMGFFHGHHHEKIMLDLGPAATYLLGLCFCPACCQAAAARGLDVEAVREGVRRYLLAAFEGQTQEPDGLGERALDERIPGLADYLAMREAVVAELVQRLGAASRVPLNLLGVTSAVLAQSAGSVAEITQCAYHRSAEEVGSTTRSARQLVGSALRLGIGLEATPHFTPDAANLAAKVLSARQAGADALYFYNYGLMPVRSLGWLREALAQSV